MLIVRDCSVFVTSTEQSCVQYECIFPFSRKMFRRFISSYLCLVRFSAMNILSGLTVIVFLLLKTSYRSLYVRNLVMIDILPSIGSPMGWDLPKWWISGFKPRSVLYILSTILSVSTGWMISPFCLLEPSHHWTVDWFVYLISYDHFIGSIKYQLLYVYLLLRNRWEETL